MCLAYIVTCVHPLQIVVVLYTLQYCIEYDSTISSFFAFHLIPAPVCQLLYYTTVLFKVLYCLITNVLFFVFIFYVLFV